MAAAGETALSGNRASWCSYAAGTPVQSFSAGVLALRRPPLTTGPLGVDEVQTLKGPSRAFSLFRQLPPDYWIPPYFLPGGSNW